MTCRDYPCLPCAIDKAHTFHDNGDPNMSYAFDGTEPPTQRGEITRREGDPRFLALLDEIEALHAAKQHDYGRASDPFANVRASEEWGVAPWIGALIRATDKVRRLQTFANKGTLRNEGVEDSLMDLAVYALIGLILYREEQ